MYVNRVLTALSMGRPGGCAVTAPAPRARPSARIRTERRGVQRAASSLVRGL